MEDIKYWFEELKEQNLKWKIVLNKIIEGLGERGFDHTKLNQQIDDELINIELDYKNEFVQYLDNETKNH